VYFELVLLALPDEATLLLSYLLRTYVAT
jgi:hypothetical protein